VFPHKQEVSQSRTMAIEIGRHYCIQSIHVSIFATCRCDRALYPEDLQSFLNRTESNSTSSNQSKGEGLDAQLEEVNKGSKAWDVGAMTASQWLRIFRNHDNLLEVCTCDCFVI